MFKLNNEPKSYVLTLHITNLILTYGTKKTLSMFEKSINGIDENNTFQMVNYFGVDFVNKHVKSIYGIELKKRKAG